MQLSWKHTLPVLAMLSSTANGAQSEYSLRSPDHKVEIRIHTTGRISYDVVFDGKPLLENCTMSIDVDHTVLGTQGKITAVKENTVDRVLKPAVKRKSAEIREHYNELKFVSDDGLAVVFRAYNEGAAYRLETSLPKDSVKVYNEEVGFKFAGDYPVFYPLEESMMSHNERFYLKKSLKELGPSQIATMPAVVDAGGPKIAIAESDIEEYPGLWLRGTNGNALAGTFPHYPLKQQLEKDRDFKVTEAADYTAVTKGTRTYPWRLIGIAEKDADLITNQLVWLTAKPAAEQDTSWIKPGKVAWDWWNANNIYGVDFKAGINNDTYKYYIDFAAKYHLDYIILDEGWYELGNVLKQVPGIDVAELVKYGQQKNVGVILWVVWKTLADQMIPALDQYASWGVKGIKVDFMQRDDELLMNFYHQLSQECAKRHMLVDFHGVQRSATLTRTYPNLISNEGVRGLEQSKWATDQGPDHNVNLPFTRMFLGPMDYTPGAMQNAQKETFSAIFNNPMSLGTRCHQLAMYAVYESPLQMLSDSPTHYMREPETIDFLSKFPTVWDETKALDGKIGEYVLVARRNGRGWYIGAMTNWTARDLDVDLSFLPAGTWHMTAFQDGVNADRMAVDYKKVVSDVTAGTKLRIHLAKGGGWAAQLSQ